MSSTSRNLAANLFTIPIELVFAILRKMEGPSLLKMYKTHSLMSEAVERQLNGLDPRNISLGKSPTLYLFANVVTVKFSRNYNFSRINKRKPNRVTFRSSATLPIETLESNIWKFVSFEEIHFADNNTAAMFLDMFLIERPGVKVLKTAHCDISLVVKALQLFNPLFIEIEYFTGDIKEILANLPIKTWVAHGGGNLKFPQGNAFEHLLPDLGDCECTQLPQLRVNERHFLLTFQEKNTFIFSMMETCISLVKM